MGTEQATDELIDLIASIEMRRREVERDAGRAAACGGALRSLQELLDREKEASRLSGPGTQHPANIEAVTAEVNKVKRLAEMTGRLSLPKIAHPAQREVSLRDAPRNASRNRGRRTMGRSSGR